MLRRVWLVVLLFAVAACSGGDSAQPQAAAPDAGGNLHTADTPSLPPTTAGATTTSPAATSSAVPSSTRAPAGTAAPAWSPKTIDELNDPVVIVNDGFGRQLPAGWYEQVWLKAADPTGEIAWDDDGAMHLQAASGGSRAGVMKDLGVDVSGYRHVVAAVHGVVVGQTLTGTGWNGREAPLALVVAYTDEAGTRHVGLAEDPDSPTNVFYRGFVVLEPDERSTMANGVAVTAGEPFIHEFDLMGLDPRPVEILYIALDGGGWNPRDAIAAEVELVAGD